MLGGSENSLSWQHCAHLNYSPLSLSDCSSTRDAFSEAHTRAGISGPRPIRGGGGGPPFTISDWFRPRYGPNVCKLLNNRETFRVAETFFSFLEWLVAQVGRTLEPCMVSYCFFFCSVAWVHPKSTSYPSS